MQTRGEGDSAKGFFRSLADLSFTSFVTARVVKFIYVISVIFVIVYVCLSTGSLSVFVGGFVSGAAGSDAVGIVAALGVFIVLAPLFCSSPSENTAEISEGLREDGRVSTPRPFAGSPPAEGDK